MRRLMNDLSAGKVDELSSQERVVFALITGDDSKRLSLTKYGKTLFDNLVQSLGGAKATLSTNTVHNSVEKYARSFLTPGRTKPFSD